MRMYACVDSGPAERERGKLEPESGDSDSDNSDSMDNSDNSDSKVVASARVPYMLLRMYRRIVDYGCCKLALV